ncbi:arabinan endo-1,5-alpha-L-arabinosidase [Rufibacter radiotolerans]|uniref:arabinan endo-1,5-alpha-L-arabinosidase n=1 Tax=Rufibacter radiotolerans TaxID=1379910 RepID=UPI0009E49C27|nr:arabinan endo-1,5-alpha-L-arabinosidase [Rufibacter radiotolerans]
MRIRITSFFLLLLALTGCAQTKTSPSGAPTNTNTPASAGQGTTPSAETQPASSLTVHDPVMAKQGNTYYLFSTGRGISVWSSTDMQNWKMEQPVFATAPAWAVKAVPGFKDNHIWAPDISYYNGQYYLYYSISAFGKNTSAIGLATNVTLDPTDPKFKWVDHGKIIESVPGQTNWNAIDPNVVVDEKGTPWMSFGSFWGGLKLVRLSKDRLSVAEDITTFPTIASRRKGLTVSANPAPLPGNPAGAGGNAIEAPFIFKKNGYYYLFASIDYCCKGAKSDYKMMVGRAKNVQGPYLDKNGVALDAGGGTILLEGNAAWNGVGHNAVYTFGKTDYLIFHGYDATQNGRPKLRVEKLTWDKEKWPVVALAQ